MKECMYAKYQRLQNAIEGGDITKVVYMCSVADTDGMILCPGVQELISAIKTKNWIMVKYLKSKIKINDFGLIDDILDQLIDVPYNSNSI